MKVLAGLSGGVDSAVAAHLLQKQGHEVHGAIMSLWDPSLPAPDILGRGCIGPEEKDIEAAQKAAAALKIPLHVIDCRAEYKKFVIENFKEEYKSGRTPNPCVWCNSLVKFGVFPQAAYKQTGFDKFATGHYARIVQKDGLYFLKQAKDLLKDQTYFLYRLSQKQLAGTLFPLGEYLKADVRRIAAEINLPVAEKPDSQDFYCGNYNNILNFPNNPGNIVDKHGKFLGRHNGIWNYTIGKRKGLGISGSAAPVYVTGINAAQNTVITGGREDLYSSELLLKNALWHGDKKGTKNAFVKIRQQHTPAEAGVTFITEEEARVVFKEPQMSVTAGQSAVFYDSDGFVLGGGIIK